MAWKFEPSRIRLARETRDVPQKDLAAQLGVSPQQLSQWELGHVKPGQDHLTNICNALDCPPKFFFVTVVDDNNQQEAA